MEGIQIEIPQEEISHFCQKWKVKTLYLFGSVLREDFDPKKSDIDLMIDFLPDHHWSLLDLVDMKEELEKIFHRTVDIVTKRSIDKSHNEYRKASILNTLRIIYDQVA